MSNLCSHIGASAATVTATDDLRLETTTNCVALLLDYFMYAALCWYYLTTVRCVYIMWHGNLDIVNYIILRTV